MATVKIKFRPSSVDGKEGTVYYQVIHVRVARQISPHTGCSPPSGTKGGPVSSPLRPMREDGNTCHCWRVR